MMETLDLSTNINAKSLKILKKAQDPGGIQTQDLLITSQTLLYMYMLGKCHYIIRYTATHSFSPSPEEVGNGVISDHEMWVWSKFIHGVCHSHWMGTVAEELGRIEP